MSGISAGDAPFLAVQVILGVKAVHGRDGGPRPEAQQSLVLLRRHVLHQPPEPLHLGGLNRQPALVRHVLLHAIQVYRLGACKQGLQILDTAIAQTVTRVMHSAH